MTDQDLLAALAEKTPDELTEVEIDYLRRRLAESAELREALLGQVQMEAYLAAALGRLNFSAADILKRAEQHRRPQSGAAAFYVGIPLVLLALLGMLYLFREAIWGGGTPDVTQVPSKIVDSTQGQQVRKDEKASGKQEHAPPVVDGHTGAEHRDGATELPESSHPDSAAKENTVSPAPPTAAAPAPPWQQVLSQEENLPPFEEVAFRPFDLARQLPRRTDLLSWFEAVPGHNHRITEVDTPRGKCGQLEGLARLKSPWTADSALKLSLENYNRLQLHFYNGSEGITLVYYEDLQNRWAAYATTRQPGKARPQTLAITATDDDRARRSELRLGGPIEVRHRAGELILSRGNIVLLTAPLSGPPEDVYFDGRVAFQGLELVRTVGDPQPLPTSPLVFDTTRPAELPWTSSKPAVAQAESLPNGSLRLAAGNSKERAECFALLPPRGLCEVIVELDDVTPGTSVYLGNEQGTPFELLRFHEDRRTKQLAARVRTSDDTHVEQFEEYKDKPTPLASAHCYVRMLYGAGNFRWWLSSDGLHWAQLDMASDGVPPNRRSLGLQVVANRPETRLTLKRIVLRELAGVSALAPQGLRDQAAGFPEAKSLGDWLAATTPLAPAGIDMAAWRRACAIRTLGTGANRDLAYALLELLLDDAAARNLPVKEQLAALNDAMLLATDLRDGQSMRVGLISRYAQLGREAWEREGLPPWTTIQWDVMSVPLVTQMQQPASMETNLRWELIDAVNSRTPAEIAEFCRRLRFFQLQQQVPLLDWAESVARREAPDAPATTIVRLKDGWRPLLVEEVSKETYNAMNDVRSVIDSEAWEDAAQMITSLAADSAGGVTPWPEDKDQLVSLPVAVQMMLTNYPPLRQAVETGFAPLAKLRIAQAIAAGDAAAVELAAVQFAGTESAADAHRWLGDQALASGWFARAIAEYERANELAPTQAGEVAPRVRLAAAMLGRDMGQPVTQSVQLGETTLSKEQFEALVVEMRGRPTTSLDASVDGTPGSTNVLPPAALQAHVKSRLDGNVGDKPQEEVVRRTNQFQVPWADRQIATALEGDLLYVANRFQVAAYNLASGQRLWQSPPPPGPMKPAQDWAMIAMRPLITPQHIYVRQLYGPSPQLVCLNKLDGKIVWTTMLSEREFLVSDPLLVQGRLVELSIELAEGQEGILRWNQFDPATGQLQGQRDLLRLRNSWGAHACCEVAALDDSVVATLGGVTVAVDAAGSVRWVRKQAVLPAEEEPRWIYQLYQRPVVHADRLYIAQPGVRAVECLDARTGTRLWLAVLPDLLAISGLVDGRLIVWTESDLRALDAANGKLLWRHAVTALHTFQLCSPSHVLYCRREPITGNTASIQTRFVWLDPATGQEQGSAVATPLTDADPRLGPLMNYKDRLWTFFGKGQHDPNRDLVELSPSGKPEQPALAAGDLWRRHLPPALATAAASAFPKWELLSGQIGERTGILPEAHGERDLLGVRTNPQWPIAFARAVEIPAGAKPRLKLRIGNDAGHDWKIEVRFGDRVVQSIDVNEQAYPDRWKTLEVDLSSLAGQSGTLVVCGRFVKGGENQTVTFWKTLEVVL